MANVVSEMKGTANLDAVIDEIGYAIALKELKKASRSALIPMRDFAKQLAPVNNRPDRQKYKSTNHIHLRDDIVIRAKKTKQQDIITSVKTTKKTKLFASLIEFGRDEFVQRRFHYYGKPLKEPIFIRIGPTKPVQFLSLAFRAKKDEAMDIFQDELQQGIEKAVKRKRKAG